MQPTMTKAQAIQQLKQMESELSSNLVVANVHKARMLEAAASAGTAMSQDDTLEAVKDVAKAVQLWITAQVEVNENAMADMEGKLRQIREQLNRLDSPILPPQFIPPNVGGRS